LIYSTRRLLSAILLCGMGYALVGCSLLSDRSDTLFQKMDPDYTNVIFSNDLEHTRNFNIYTYKDFYAGGGVAIGDINNDGLPDLFLTANQKENKLYLNKGNFVFEDITAKAGVGGTKPWSTGVSMADIDGNGYLDIYVSNSGSSNPKSRQNELYLNNGDLTFTEKAVEYGLADTGYSVHASFFDYDNDGDLDVFVLNNYAYQQIGQYDQKSLDRNDIDPRGGDRFYMNTMADSGGNSIKFVDITQKSGIYSSGFGFGLGVSVSDINRDGYIDIYVSNDFFERDYLYMNNTDGTFREVLTQKFLSTSTTSMGGDIADLNNDGYPEIFVSDMLPASERRLKSVADFITYQTLVNEESMGYHRKYSRNTLQFNYGNGFFGEIGRYANIDASDWSWGALMADFTLNGLREIFVANGFFKDVTNKDHLLRMNRPSFRDSMITNNQINFDKLIEMTPSVPASNMMFTNNGDLQFKNVAREFGLHEPGFSNGAAYGDLNDDGALDLVVNNVNAQADIYKNKTLEKRPEAKWLGIKLKGTPFNTSGIGAKVELKYGSQYRYAELIPQRSYQSSMPLSVHFGLNSNRASVDSILVIWPDGSRSLRTEVAGNQTLSFSKDDTSNRSDALTHLTKPVHTSNTSFTRITGQEVSAWQHQESDFNDFRQSPLLFNMRSTEGPCLCTGDSNNDQRDDFYVGGAAGQSGALFLQQKNGTFAQASFPILETHKASEDVECLFFDADGDGSDEIYVGSGSSEFPQGSKQLRDRLYTLQNGNLMDLSDNLPDPEAGNFPTGAVAATDVENDGDLDLFVGQRMTNYTPSTSLGYGVPVSGFIWQNNGAGVFSNITGTFAPQLQADSLQSAGITDAVWNDMDGNGTPDLILAGEWMPVTIFNNRGDKLQKLTRNGLDSTNGLWQTLEIKDINNDGYDDILAGNLGMNNRFHASKKFPLQLYATPLKQNGELVHLFAQYRNGQGPYPVALMHNLIQQLPHLRQEFRSYSSYATTALNDIFTEHDLNRGANYQINVLESMVFWNSRNGFKPEPLPMKAQWSMLFDIEQIEANDQTSWVLGGNLYRVQPQAGAYDAMQGLHMGYQKDTGFVPSPLKESNFSVTGPIRSVKIVQTKTKKILIVSRNNSNIELFEIR